MLSGGTWLAVPGDGRFAAVTNQRALVVAPPGLRSRGHAVVELAAAADAEAYLAALDPTRCASMKLAWGDARGAAIACVRRETASIEIERLGHGVHVLTNDRSRSPGYPRGERLAKALAGPRRWPEVAHLLATHLADHTCEQPPPSHLPPDLARELTATCIHSPTYGIRSSTILAATGDRLVGYLHPDGAPCVTSYADLLELV